MFSKSKRFLRGFGVGMFNHIRSNGGLLWMLMTMEFETFMIFIGISAVIAFTPYLLIPPFGLTAALITYFALVPLTIVGFLILKIIVAGFLEGCSEVSSNTATELNSSPALSDPNNSLSTMPKTSMALDPDPSSERQSLKNNSDEGLLPVQPTLNHKAHVQLEQKSSDMEEIKTDSYFHQSHWRFIRFSGRGLSYLESFFRDQQEANQNSETQSLLPAQNKR